MGPGPLPRCGRPLIPLGELVGLEASARFSSELVFASGAYAAVVEIERETGRLTVHRIAAVDDAGRIVNPLLAEGQVVGGAIQGLGAVLTEELVFDEEGQPRNASFMEYLLLSAAEAPRSGPRSSSRRPRATRWAPRGSARGARSASRRDRQRGDRCPGWPAPRPTVHAREAVAGTEPSRARSSLSIHAGHSSTSP